VLVLALLPCLVVQGCSAQEWITTAESDLPVILQIVTNILNIADVAAIPAAQSAGAQAKTDLALAQQLVTQFKAGDSGTTISAVNSALAAVNTDIGSILSAVHITNAAKQAAITAAVGVALSTLLAIESIIPTTATTNASAVGISIANARADAIKAHLSKPPSASAVKAKYNSIIKVQYPAAVIK
jgi:hypothetical protein